MSGEHVWSAWIGRLYGKPKSAYSLQATVADGATKHWKSRSVDMKAHVVCEECNNGWMSHLEEDASATMKYMIR